MKQKCQVAAWWPKIDFDVENFVRARLSVISGKSIKQSQSPLQPKHFKKDCGLRFVLTFLER